jgi:hypothetical protein
MLKDNTRRERAIKERYGKLIKRFDPEWRIRVKCARN